MRMPSFLEVRPLLEPIPGRVQGALMSLEVGRVLIRQLTPPSSRSRPSRPPLRWKKNRGIVSSSSRARQTLDNPAAPCNCAASGFEDVAARQFHPDLLRCCKGNEKVLVFAVFAQRVVTIENGSKPGASKELVRRLEDA